MTRKTRLSTILLALAVVMTGCGESAEIAASDDAQTASAGPTVPEPPVTDVATDDPCLEHAYDEEACLAQMNDDATEAESAPEPEPESADEDPAYAADFEVNIKGASWKHSGARVNVTRMALRDRDDFCGSFAEYDEPTACYDHYDGATVVALDMRVVNETGRDIDWYPDQAELVLGSEQIAADMVGPDQLGGTIREGTKRNGQAWWLSDQSVDDVEALGEMRLIMGSPTWADDYEPITGNYDDIDLTITW